MTGMASAPAKSSSGTTAYAAEERLYLGGFECYREYRPAAVSPGNTRRCM